MGKKAKEHRKKVEKRNRIIAQERQRFEKAQKELFETIKEENRRGLFNNDPILQIPQLDSPILFPQGDANTANSTILSGPKI